jgi:hypothetical protein
MRTELEIPRVQGTGEASKAAYLAATEAARLQAEEEAKRRREKSKAVASERIDGSDIDTDAGT